MAVRFNLLRTARDGSVKIAAGILFIIAFLALAAPLIAPLAPDAIDPLNRNLRPMSTMTVLDHDGNEQSVTAVMGTDNLGRDLFSRVIYGGRISLQIGITVTMLSVLFGGGAGLLSGYNRWFDGIVMRILDGLMAVPAILLAIALVSVMGTGMHTVIVAITIVEIPRVARLVRSVVLSLREQPFIEACVSFGMATPRLLFRHILPNALAPLVVQATFVMSAAILLEATLSFLGLGIPPEIPTWGNIIAEGRTLFQLYPQNIWFPALFLSGTILSVNILGDYLRDRFDPKTERQL